MLKGNRGSTKHASGTTAGNGKRNSVGKIKLSNKHRKRKRKQRWKNKTSETQKKEKGNNVGK